MTERLNDNLVELALEIVNLNGEEKELALNPNSTRHGELYLSWNKNQFHANLTIYSEPRTSGLGSYLYPPETTWHEEETNFQSPKIKAVSNWLQTDWGFQLT